MEKELNYISEKVEYLDNKIARFYDHLDKGNGTGGRIGEGIREDIKKMEEEKQLLENIMNALTINELT